MPWLRRVWRFGIFNFFRDNEGKLYLRWARGRFWRLT
jgi:hypothetical protein